MKCGIPLPETRTRWNIFSLLTKNGWQSFIAAACQTPYGIPAPHTTITSFGGLRLRAATRKVIDFFAFVLNSFLICVFMAARFIIIFFVSPFFAFSFTVPFFLFAVNTRLAAGGHPLPQLHGPLRQRPGAGARPRGRRRPATEATRPTVRPAQARWNVGRKPFW